MQTYSYNSVSKSYPKADTQNAKKSLQRIVHSDPFIHNRIKLFRADRQAFPFHITTL